MGFKEFISNGWNKVQEGVGQVGKWLGDHQSVLTGLGKGAEMLGTAGVPFASAIGKGLNMAADIGKNYNEDKAFKESGEMKKAESNVYKEYLGKMKNQLEQPVAQQTLTSYGNILPLGHSAIDKINYKYNPYQIKPTVFKNEMEFEKNVRKTKTKKKGAKKIKH
ncbi:hypothetical protein M9Y10_037189 [Tritrichomonas musculus]|uniref:Uncharacterized protein n=1 Tax=Tritrichomonas musculus TaxID=1915356 RepID=A0ABR2GT64_9EUKA